MKITREQGALLLSWARARLLQELGGPRAAPPEGAWAESPAATFVTLRWRESGELQGCIGALEPRRTLVDDVAYNVIAAALYDPRSAPLELADVDGLDLEISILSALERVEAADEASALAALRPKIDGVVFTRGSRRATLLPSMWEHFPTPERFLAALKAKAGCAASGWSEDVRLSRYTVDLHADHAPAEERCAS